VCVADPRLAPARGNVFFTDYLLIVELTILFGQLPFVVLHELFHMLAGRRLGLHSSMHLGHRLYFLVAETKLDGLVAAGAFAVTVLPAGAGAVPAAFADPSLTPGLGDTGWTPGTGSPVLDCGIAYFDCTLETVHVAGDHDVCVGRVRAFGAMGTGAPLVFAGGSYLSISARSATS
jgi:hypothetical protein